eukprot:CAMPEP_0171984726 /NCGR_PEP_ID=MMETSP0993-20121228/273976_1 /TAXON_ID=483369 /ORGANISM="non described non described, Strain CCMP2098" /LENGTH=643 /DNA_ID=CAMNT_0012637559 /DNA_START=241 /DNA_END=2172 /DNA_ORIENTATION=+
MASMIEDLVDSTDEAKHEKNGATSSQSTSLSSAVEALPSAGTSGKPTYLQSCDEEEAQDVKRRRRVPPSFRPHGDDTDNKHLRSLQQAVENSRTENLSTDVGIEEAPVFYPTVEEFKDPIKYISSIKPHAQRFGICRVVPPEGWDNPTQVDFNSKKKFATKLQRMSLMQEGRAMGDGQFYDAKQYEKMADEFRQSWIENHHGNPEKVTFRNLEVDYWSLVKNTTGKMVEVEYGNDLSTHEYDSGFPLRKPSDPALGTVTAPFGSDEYYRTCGWNLNNISCWPGSAIRCVTHSIDGINKPWLYMGMMFSSFCWHREDIYLASINYMHSGASKQWYGIPGAKANSFRRVMEKQMKLRLKEVPDLEHHITTQIAPSTLLSKMEKQMKLRLKEVPDLEHHITTQIAPSTLLSNNVPVYKTRQEAGQFIVTFPEAYHCGFSYGFNCGEAVNFATSDWIPHGSQSVVDYRLKGKKECFSFDRLLFTLTYHLKELSLESCKMLLRELEILQADETHFRKQLYSTGVQDVSKVAQLPNEGRMSSEIPEELANYDEQDVSKVAQLPNEGRMSSEIPEELANYDDQRVCSTCSHTCFLSAVCCSCNEHAVSCPKCCDYLCGCPRTNKYLLEWHSLDEIGEIIGITSAHIDTLE